MVRDGLWRSDNDHDQQMAWEESVRLRERMFWARVGGGVVPRLQQNNHKSLSANGSASAAERDSLEDIPEGKPITVKPVNETDLPKVTVRMPSNTARPLSYVTPPGSTTDDHSSQIDTAVGGDDGTTPQFEDASEQLDRELEIAAAVEELGAKDITPVSSKQRESQDLPSRARSRADSRSSSRAPSPEKQDPTSNRNSTTSTKRASVLSVTPAAERNASVSTLNNRPISPSQSRSRSPRKQSTSPHKSTPRDNELEAERNRWSKSKRASVQSVTTGASAAERNGSVISVAVSEGEGEGEVEGLGVKGVKERKGSSVLERVREMERK
jgi:hypothetical protein